jgi:hypothetical protein
VSMTSAVSATTTTFAYTTISSLSQKDPHYSITDLFLTFFQERVKDVVKTLRYIAFWSRELIPNLPPSVSSFGTMMGDLKNFISATEIPGRAVLVSRALSGFWEEITKKVKDNTSTTWNKVGECAYRVLKELSILTNLLADSFDLSTRFIVMDQTFMSCFQTFNFGAIIAGNGINTIEQYHHINGMKQIDTRRTTLYLAHLARDVSYVAFGLFGTFFFLSGIAIVPAVMVACVTSGLLFGMGGYFYEKIYDPEGKGRNLNPSVVMENMLNR